MKTRLHLFLFGAFLLLCKPAFCQNAKPGTFTASYVKKPVADALREVETRFNVKVFYRPEWLEGQTITIDLKESTLGETLKAILTATDLHFATYDAANIVLLPATENMPEPQNQSFGQTPSTAQSPNAIVIGGNRLAPRNQKLTLSGTVTDGKRNEPAIGASVSVPKLGVGAVTDANGNYELKLLPGKHEVSFNYFGLETQVKIIQLNGSGNLNTELQEKAFSLGEVQIEAERKNSNVSGSQMGVNKLSMREIKKLPALLGEVDVVKSLQLLPGVTTVGEAASGFNVRGGNTDQNLILLDDVPIFNPTHLFGFFSVFNPDAIQDVTFYRGAIPAQMGGRLSAILDVRQKEGNYQKYQGTGGIGIVSGRLALEGPLVKDRISFLAAGRSSYSNWIFKRLPDATLRDDKASFYDGTIKLSARLSDLSKIILSGYRSHDSFQFSADTAYSWNTTNGSFTFNHIFSDKLILNAVAFSGNYDLNLDFKSPLNEARYESGIKQTGIKLDLTSRLEKHTVSVGGNSTFYTFNQGELKPTAERSNINADVLPNDKALESAFYINDEFALTSWFSLTAGIRYSMYQNYGNGAVFQYTEGGPKNFFTLTDTVAYGENEVVQKYSGFEPRASVKFQVNENNSVKAGYARTRQYMHVISNTLTISPVDIWKTSNEHIKPQIGYQYSVGYFRNLKQNTIETSVEIYYKQIQNQLDYKEGAELFLNPALETELITAKGEAYGLELLLNKKAGRLTGWASYAFSRSFLKTDSPFKEEQINNGQKYPTNYDKPHTLNLVINYQLTRRLSASANFMYSTGRPFTASPAFYVIDGNVVPYYSDRNAYRLPDYHRLDLSLTMLTNLKKNKKWEGSWNLAVYNVYARENANSIFYRHTYGSQPKPYKMSIIGTPIPSLSYNFKF